MAAGLSAKRAYGITYRKLKKIEAELDRAGIKAVYKNREVVDEATEGKDFQIYYTRLNASNGEAALLPVLYLKEAGTRVEYFFMSFDRGFTKLIELHRKASRLIEIKLNQPGTPTAPGKSITRLAFKDEDEDDDGRIIGPVFAYFADGTKGRVEGGWFTRREAEKMAEDISVPLIEL